MSKNLKGIILKKPTYSIEVKYSDEAIKNKLLRFTATAGEPFELSAEELISILVNQVNTDTLLPTFVDVEKVNVVQVMRQIKCILNDDMKKGQEISINYTHPYPLEFAILEEAYKIALIEQKDGVRELTKEFIDEVKAKIQPSMDEFIKKFYKGHKQIDLEKPAEEVKKS